MSSLIEFLFPPTCVSCGEMLGPVNERRKKAGRALCNNCRAEWENEKLRVCSFCFKPMIDCRCMKGRLYYCGCTDLIKLCTYSKGEQKAVKSLLFCLKRDAISRCEEFLASQLALSLKKYLAEYENADFVVTNVPRRKAFVIEYGYDHAALIAKLAAETAGLEYEELISRTRDSMEQKYLSAEERISNVKGIFGLAKYKETVFGKKIILVDDIVTSGASMQECSSLLFSAGAESVVCACIAMSDK